MFTEQLGFLAALVVGLSMGALTAYELAATRPDLIRLLVLEEMPPPDPANPPKPIPRHPDPGASYDWRALIAMHRWRNAPPLGWWEFASRIHAKTLVLGAAHSTLRQDRLEELSRRLPTAASPHELQPRWPRGPAERVPGPCRTIYRPIRQMTLLFHRLVVVSACHSTLRG
jgi:pimeloyl-ACP methyl ester carboxylesterase